MWFPFLLSLFVFNSIPIKYGIDPAFDYYVEKIYVLSDGNLDGSKIHINFGEPLWNSNAATCYPWIPEIVISKRVWEREKPISRTLLLAHEITHCLNKKLLHINGLDKFGCAKHYMHWQMNDISCDRYKFKNYVEQMKVI